MEIDNISSSEFHLTSDELGDPQTVHGVAIGENDVTKGKSGVVKKWTRNALEEATDTLTKKPLVKNHENSDVNSVVGKIEETKYEPGVGVLFEAKLADEKISEKIQHGLLDVSARIEHPNMEDLETDEKDRTIIDKIKRFVNLSVVPTGAAKSNKVEPGPAEELSAAELAANFDDGSTEDGSETSDGLRDCNRSSGDEIGIEVLTGNDLGEFVEGCTAENKTEKLTVYEV